ncbi:hypothetical protein BASA50_007307 [Batrachochytrium salamandrivorans]|uniref:Uncharacterized protein n=1 Tax=Batrachochytrium salamandrivorans TaxID=1357716 RepID=A0ABQ8F7D3_9FUNG|nr:hypothetical protein BASA60_001178 [Batrachochytrium salamandrivorans]KAH6593497.1 hypothetical protein BASA50_007307 [Batrachochytrium salamandrivorans]KAH9265015.1 hypothetical protein BASA83_011439 [Batrachochytrium salamandrivorans]
MQFFHLFSFVVVASYAAALPQPAGLSEKYSNNVDTNLASGLEARSYQPGLNSKGDLATSTLLKRRGDSLEPPKDDDEDDDEGSSGDNPEVSTGNNSEGSTGENSESDPFLSSTFGPNETVGSDFTDDDVSSENLASTIDKVGDDVYIFFKDGEKAANKIGSHAGDLLKRYLRRHSYVNVALRRWTYLSTPDISEFIASSSGKDKYLEVKLELKSLVDGFNNGFKEKLHTIVDNATKILNNDGSDIENVKNIVASCNDALSNRSELILFIAARLPSFGNGVTLGDQLDEVIKRVNAFNAKQYELHDKIMEALGVDPSQE